MMMIDSNQNEVERSPIQKFYDGKNVFITGATGFLGKVLIEKLLRSTQVGTIYLLVREKKGKAMHTRVDELLDDVIFKHLKVQQPKYKHRIVAVGGDCAIAGLGLNITDRQTLINNVDIVFHVAATVRFDERLDLSYMINVNGTRSVINLCRQIEHLKAFIHVSTAYANSHLSEIDEAFYDYPVNYEDLGNMLEKLSPDEIQEKTPIILGKWPNTYAFTKAMAEALVRDQTAGLPVGVFRPAIVTSCYKEPLPSWIDNLYGPTGVCAGVMSGLLHSLRCDSRIKANIVPVDMCVAALIAACWETGTQQAIERPPIYNYVSTNENSITWNEFHKLAEFYGVDYPFIKLIAPLSFETTCSLRKNQFNQFIYHMVPAALMDAVILLTGNKPRILGMYKKIHRFTQVIEYFATTDIKFENGNVQKLHQHMDVQDRTIFSLSMNDLHWNRYFRTYVLGIREYLLKDPMETLEAAKVRAYRLNVMFAFFKYTIAFIVLNLLWNSLLRLIF